jgi:hypothetical protein
MPELLERIFENHYQVTETSRGWSHRPGVGLYIAKDMVTWLGWCTLGNERAGIWQRTFLYPACFRWTEIGRARSELGLTGIESADWLGLSFSPGGFEFHSETPTALFHALAYRP